MMGEEKGPDFPSNQEIIPNQQFLVKRLTIYSVFKDQNYCYKLCLRATRIYYSHFKITAEQFRRKKLLALDDFG